MIKMKIMRMKRMKNNFKKKKIRKTIILIINLKYKIIIIAIYKINQN